MTERRDKKDLLALLREADSELQRERLSPAADRRLEELVAGRPPRRMRPALVLAPLAAAAVALLVWALIPGRQQAPAPKRDHQLSGFSLVAGTARALGARQVRCHSAGCTLTARDQDTRLELTQGAVVSRKDRHIRVLRGRATLDVTPRRRPRGALRVYVSHGHIEVLGTLFTVRQQRAGGQVTLHRGAIRFVGHLGQVREVAPGQTLRWPLDDPPKTAVAPKKETTKPTPPQRTHPSRKLTPRDTETLHNKVARLRSQGRFLQAARALRSALPRVAQKEDRVTFSYELGEILTYQLSDRAAACRHWKAHLRRYGPGSQGKDIHRARQKAGCFAASPGKKTKD